MRVVLHELVEGQAHMARLIGAFGNFSYATNYELIKLRELGEWKM
jgi:hypothetical protein